MTQDDGDKVVALRHDQPALSRGSQAVAIAIAVINGLVELGKWAMALGIILLAGFGLASLLLR